MLLGWQGACLRREDGGSGEAPGLLEIRDAKGGITFTMRRLADGHVFTDTTGTEGHIAVERNGSLRARDTSGRLMVLTVQSGGAGLAGFDLSRDGTPYLRVRYESGQWRLTDASAIPRGRVRSTSQGALAYNPGGILAAQVSHGGGRLVVSDRNGSVLAYASSSASPLWLALTQAAALTPIERALFLAAPNP